MSNVLTCAFCGHTYPPDTPPTQHAELTKHVWECKEHPLAIALSGTQDQLRILADAAEAYGKHSFTETFYDMQQSVSDARHLLATHAARKL